MKKEKTEVPKTSEDAQERIARVLLEQLREDPALREALEYVLALPPAQHPIDDIEVTVTARGAAYEG